MTITAYTRILMHTVLALLAIATLPALAQEEEQPAPRGAEDAAGLEVVSRRGGHRAREREQRRRAEQRPEEKGEVIRGRGDQGSGLLGREASGLSSGSRSFSFSKRFAASGIPTM